MSLVRSPLSFRCTTLPGNSQFTIVLDSTYGLVGGATTAVAAGSAFFTPGTLKGRWAGATVRYTALCTTQNCTALEEILTGQAGTSADWETQGASGTQTVTAATTLVRAWRPEAPDFRLRIQAGATGPGALTVEVTVTWGGDYLV